MEYKISQYAKKYGVTTRTVWNWIKNNQLETRITETGRWRIIEEKPLKDQRVFVYARVSSSENKKNLETQKERLINYCNAKGYKVDGIITEIGSGLNDKRPKLEKLLMDDTITHIVVEHKDRLARFGLNYIEKLLSMNGRVIEIINNTETEKEDLMQDFVSIITSFTSRLYGQRRTKRQTERIIKELENKNAESN